MLGSLLGSVFVTRTASALLFFTGLCEIMIHLQQYTLSDYEVGSPMPFIFSSFAIAAAGSGLFLVHKEFIPRTLTLSMVSAATSVLGAREGREKWLDLKKLKACSTYAPDTKIDPCLDYFDDSSVLNSQISIPERYRNENVQRRLESEGGSLRRSTAPVEVPMSAPTSHAMGRGSSSGNATWYTNEFDNDISCYGNDINYFVAAYYCEFWHVAQGTQKNDYCYCVAESDTDGSATCHEYSKYHYCGDLLTVVREMELGTYVLGALSCGCSVVLAVSLCFVWYLLVRENQVVNLFDLWNEWRRAGPVPKKAVAHFANEGIVMSHINTNNDDNKRGSGKSGTKVAPAPQCDDSVRPFDAPDGGEEEEEVRPPEEDDSKGPPPLSLFGGLLTKVQPSTVADPVTPRRRLFQNRVAPQEAGDAELDVANVIPYPRAVPLDEEAEQERLAQLARESTASYVTRHLVDFMFSFHRVQESEGAV